MTQFKDLHKMAISNCNFDFNNERTSTNPFLNIFEPSKAKAHQPNETTRCCQSE